MDNDKIVPVVIVIMMFILLSMSGCIEGVIADVDNDGIIDIFDDYVGPEVESPITPDPEEHEDAAPDIVVGTKFAQRFKIKEDMMKGIKLYFLRCKGQEVTMIVEEAKNMNRPTGEVIRDIEVEILPDDGMDHYVTFNFEYTYFQHLCEDYWFTVFCDYDPSSELPPPDLEVAYATEDYEDGIALRSDGTWICLVDDLAFDIIYRYDKPDDNPGELTVISYSTDNSINADIYPYQVENIGSYHIACFDLGDTYEVYKLDGSVRINEEFMGYTEVRFYMDYMDNPKALFWMAYVTMRHEFEWMDYEFWICHDSWDDPDVYTGDVFKIRNTHEFSSYGCLHVKKI